MTLAPELKPEFTALKETYKLGKVEGAVVYRDGSATLANLTPKAKDIDTGLSARMAPVPGKNQVIDPAKFENLCAVCDNAVTGHVSIAPIDKSLMQGWIDSRDTLDNINAAVHEFTAEVQADIVGEVRVKK
ncbi:hypothetical protein FJ546_22270 [Mesorhizobium sp. B2-4-19]|uniref:hypothetical protein n=1 Tax=Mesorhizobium sp. B2-4-19 TaxID=2589930 RepID=UPI001125B884|nr:hypothetical protein [Mesorhizobium sp. B2-4-19]TPK59212.1 hypothetical protein FJ546_22270 [Mesorhizobium sp. B2-4-19]